ncbi:MAG: DUF4397 domain-containing protein [Chloroflexi bacterium]|nr:DUF4397 domain-containing protein [Chloroflexota bacterium]
MGAASKAMVRVMHASPDAPAVDVYVNGDVVLTSVPFKAISDYLMLDAGEYDLGIKAAGAAAGDPYVLEATDVAVQAGKAYTVAATGKLADIGFTILADNPQAESDTAKLRVVHFSPDTPAVDVGLKGTAPADALIKGLEFPKASSYLDVPGGTYDVEVRPAGTDTVALDLSGTTLEDGKNYSVFAVGLLEGTPALGVVVAIDGTLPDTATLGLGEGSSPALPMLLVAAAAAFTSLLLVRRLGSVRTR